MSGKTTPEIQEVWQAYKDDPGRHDLRNQLVEHYLPLVKYNAYRIWSRLPEGVELEDLESAGAFGLMDAVEAFDLSRGVKFETYSLSRIRGAMLDELRVMDWVPRLVRMKASRLDKAVKKLDTRLGRPPSPEELSEELGLSLAELERLTRESQATTVLSLHKVWFETDSYRDVREIDILTDKRAEDPTRRLRDREQLQHLLRGLSCQERLLVIMYYYEQTTMKEIGEALSLSESRISQMHTQLMQRLALEKARAVA